MIRLLYISTARQPTSAATLADILDVSRRNNARHRLTGLLIAGEHRFLQALEGPQAAVTATYERICRDPRHYAIVKLVQERITARQFTGWAMGVQHGSTDNQATVDEAVAALVASIADPSLRGYFTGFAERQAAA